MMKTGLFFCLTVCAIFAIKPLQVIQEKPWMLNIIVLNSDTIFMKHNPKYTLAYNLEINQAWMETKADTLKVKSKADENFNKLSKMTFVFNNDSLFTTSKMRSGGKLNPNEMDTGFYHISNDTIYMVNYTRRLYRSIFVMDLEQNRIYFDDDFDNHHMYWEYLQN